MPYTISDPEDIRRFIINNVGEHPRNITRITADHFGITPGAAVKHVNKLVDVGQLRATGKTKARGYTLTTLVSQFASIAVTPDLEENVTWQEWLLPYLANVEQNVRTICQHGFTEMVNNVVSHSGANTMEVHVKRTAARISMWVVDDGVGIFQRITQDLGLADPRHALLELSKGKLTSDPDHHSGEGIFFTSRMFDDFSIRAGELFYWKQLTDDGWLLEAQDAEPFVGTRVVMEISPDTNRTTTEVFEEYTSAGEDNFRFSKTHVPLALAKYPQEELMSRSQARRVLARFERFSEVLLDFHGIEIIGQGFADEIFRVFRREHPEIRVIWGRTTEKVDRMISRAVAAAIESESANGPRQPS